MHTTTKRRRLRRRYRKMAAAVAGAAVMSTALLHGFPVAKVLAAPAPAVESAADAAAQDQGGGVEAQARERDRERDRDHDRRDRDWRDRDRWEARSPVQVVMDNAATFGFDVRSDSFSLMSKTGNRATVRVRHDGQTFKVDLERDGGSWVITTIRGIGDRNHPATYTPASFFPGAALLPVPAAPAERTTIFETAAFSEWSWAEAVYPADMAFGIALQDPRPAGLTTTVPGAVLDRLDFGRQMLLFAHVGSVSPQGYGVGIAKVVRSGNDLTVTVRTKSPRDGDTAATKTDDFLAVDRANLDFRKPVRIAFVDQYGTVLVTYTVVPR
ncbi:hypothetical protein [Anaeroselena agilis]|uniref:PrcB C-terminal domain-containing protein n=1 Tax=Anaeroselena agilis TaxID=3063788 RepID=A0ABU3P0Z9_9FIRM|nr:hypothetical protein [Selenomonadales bacterium 4137-cl]